VVWTYLVMLAASHLYQEVRDPSPVSGGLPVLAFAVPGGARGAGEERMVYREWLPREARVRDAGLEDPRGGSGAHPAGRAPRSESRPPLVLIHGSPGNSYEFRKLAPLVAAAGYRVIAVDLPGFGQSSRNIADHSMRRHAERVLALMDSLGIDRAHVLGWSNGGGVVLNMADMAPSRLASLTMLAAVGDQAREGSGSYSFEHAKYALGLAAFATVPAVVPHFGRFGTLADRTGFLWNFWDSDQRPLKGIMERLRVPTLIIQGRNDCLVHAAAAEEHHRLIRTSSLVMLRANHFLPLAQASETAGALAPFLERHDHAGVKPLTGVADVAPVERREGLAGVVDDARGVVRGLPWWGQAPGVAAVVIVAPTVGVLVCAALVVSMDLDFLVGIVGIAGGLALQTGLLMAFGRIMGERVRRAPLLGGRLRCVSAADWARRMRRGPWAEGWVHAFLPRSRASSVLGAALAGAGGGALVAFVLARLWAIAVWTVVSFVVAGAGMMALHYAWPQAGGVAGAVLVALLALVVWAAPMLFVRRGRQALLARWERLTHYEYWPACLFYLPLAPYVAWLTWRYRGVTLPTCCNPGIGNGGGLIGESKHDIMTRLSDGPHRPATVLVEAGGSPAERSERVREAMSRVPGLSEFPIVLKPDAGQRGFAVRVIRSDEQLEPYFEMMPNAAIVQPYCPGPHECGVLWARCDRRAERGRAGFIFSVTRKEFPQIVGDGVHTVEELLHAHPRHRRQVHVFLERLADQASHVPAYGEVLRLGSAGNHCQGALFRDGADLITPGLSAAIDRLAREFRGGLDFGRFDLRYASEEALANGEFTVIELNGTTSESTNLYDPGKTIFWAYGVLIRQWRLLFEIGARRRNTGARPMRLTELVRAVRAHYGTRRGSALAD
jgi:pimeloyl-ACP methyl ester carboxylesterase